MNLYFKYHIYRKYSCIQAWTNSVDPDQRPQNTVSDQGLNCMLLIQQLLDTETDSQMDFFQFLG